MKKSMKKLPLWCGALLICCVLTFLGMPKEVRAADGTLNLNETKNITIEEFGKRVYAFRVPNTGNFTVTIKNTNPTGNEELDASLYDSNNNEIIPEVSGVTYSLPNYSSKGNRTYYLKVEDGYYAWRTSFDIKVSYKTTKNWEAEDNNTSKTANKITAKKDWYGMINGSSKDCDYYKIKLNGKRKVSINFGPAEVDGEQHSWKVSLMNSKNESVEIFKGSTRQTYQAYLKKGTYYLKVENEYRAENMKYKLRYTERQLNIKKPTITGVGGTAHNEFFGTNYTDIYVKLKNSGDCQGYYVKVAKKKNMSGNLAKEAISFGDGNSRKKVTLTTRFPILRKYYVQVRGFVDDPFGHKIYGNYSKVKTATMNKSVYNKYRKKISY